MEKKGNGHIMYTMLKYHFETETKPMHVTEIWCRLDIEKVPQFKTSTRSLFVKVALSKKLYEDRNSGGVEQSANQQNCNFSKSSVALKWNAIKR